MANNYDKIYRFFNKLIQNYRRRFFLTFAATLHHAQPFCPVAALAERIFAFKLAFVLKSISEIYSAVNFS